VRVRQLAGGTRVGEQPDLPESVLGIAVHGKNTIITAAGTSIAVHQLALPRPMR
jgi:hypothetical protein